MKPPTKIVDAYGHLPYAAQGFRYTFRVQSLVAHQAGVLHGSTRLPQMTESILMTLRLRDPWCQAITSLIPFQRRQKHAWMAGRFAVWWHYWRDLLKEHWICCCLAANYFLKEQLLSCIAGSSRVHVSPGGLSMELADYPPVGYL